MPLNRLDDLALVLSGVSVHYQVRSEPINTLKEHAIRLLQGKRVGHREVRALFDVDLRVKQGESVGIIGRNGAGKSTLLKVIAHVLRPTTGRVWTRGTIAPLIGLGAGFHPELTGYENIFLNGAILGFSHKEMLDKYEQIVEFSELHEFIHSPLRTYSSGMSLRLGFAIAASTNPDLLLIDEVLAVGDEAFKKKCLTRMEEFRASGTTVLFVSHALDAIQDTCNRTIWIDEGRVHMSGHSNEVIRAYRSYAKEQRKDEPQPIRY